MNILMEKFGWVSDESAHRPVTRWCAGEDHFGTEVVPPSQTHITFPARHAWFYRDPVSH